jgi:tRNA dimethylallyltransferase
MSRPLLVIGGPTASGKSALALELCERIGGEIVNADSQQVYGGMDVGTGKPTTAEQARVPHHLYDVAHPSEQLDAARFLMLADAAIEGIRSRGRWPVVVGGTGLWLRALWRGLVDVPPRDEAFRSSLRAEAGQVGWPVLHTRLAGVDAASAARIAPTDGIRIERALEVFTLTGEPLSVHHERHALGAPRHEALHLLLDLPMNELEANIRGRVNGMFADGLVEETRTLMADPSTRGRLEGVMGYREALGVIEGRLELTEARELVVRAQRRYAKRQRTWFNGESHWARARPDEGVARALSLVARAIG